MPGALECKVADYVQGLLSAFPGADANADGQVGAADLTAIALAVGTDDAHADVDGDGIVGEHDRATAVASLFGGPALAGPPAFEGRPIFAGGPFSDRNPFPDPTTGTPSDHFPANAFATAVPLTRLQRMAWTVRLLGADAVPEVQRQSPRPHPGGRRPTQPLSRRSRHGRLDQRHGFRRAVRRADDGAAGHGRRDAEASAAHVLRSARRPHDRGHAERARVRRQPRPHRLDAGPASTATASRSATRSTTRPSTTTASAPTSRTRRSIPTIPAAASAPKMNQFLRFVLVQLAGATEFPEPFCFDE